MFWYDFMLCFFVFVCMLGRSGCNRMFFLCCWWFLGEWFCRSGFCSVCMFGGWFQRRLRLVRWSGWRGCCIVLCLFWWVQSFCVFFRLPFWRCVWRSLLFQGFGGMGRLGLGWFLFWFVFWIGLWCCSRGRDFGRVWLVCRNGWSR